MISTLLLLELLLGSMNLEVLFYLERESWRIYALV